MVSILRFGSTLVASIYSLDSGFTGLPPEINIRDSKGHTGPMGDPLSPGRKRNITAMSACMPDQQQVTPEEGAKTKRGQATVELTNYSTGEHA